MRNHASPLWTLRRPYFEPDVAANAFDRGENHDPGKATKRRKRLLTKEARLENGPLLARCFCSVLIRSLAPICPASHEGVPRRAISSSASPSCLRAVAHFNFLPRRSSRHRRALPCKPHIRRDDVPTTVPHSGRESSRRTAPLYSTAAFAPGRTTATPPWIRVPAQLYSAGLIRKVNQDTGFSTAPSGTTPWVANRHKAIRSRRAIATTMTLRMRFPVPPTRSRNQMT